MPRKRKSNLSKNSTRARAAKINRSEESSVHAEFRRQEQTRRQSALRARESTSQRQERLECQVERQATLRASETPLQTQIRLDEQAERQATLRASETFLQTQLRLRREAEQQADVRARETPEQLQARRIVHAQMQTSRRRNFVRNNWSVFNNSGFLYDPLLEYHNHSLIVIGSMNKKCHFCDALKWKDETPGMCCSNGKVSLPLLGEPDEPLKTLYLCDTDESRQFLSKIRKYNSCFQMTSFGVDKMIRMPGFSPTFTVQGQIYHQIGSLFPADNEQH